MSASQHKIVRELLRLGGRTYTEDAGIRLSNKPAPLFQLLVLSMLLSTRIRADIAVAAAAELISSGYGTPRKMLDASWQDRVDALGRAHYVRYDESTATALGENAQLLLDTYRGDLRRLRNMADGDARQVRKRLKEFKRIGDVGVNIFCREAQDVWPELQPYFDDRVLKGAKQLGLPTEPDQLTKLTPTGDLTKLTAALVRVTLDDDLAKSVMS